MIRTFVAAYVALFATPAWAKPIACLDSAAAVKRAHPGEWARWRQIDGRQCWYAGKDIKPKSELAWAKHSRGGRPEPVEIQGASVARSPVPREPAPTRPQPEESDFQVEQALGRTSDKGDTHGRALPSPDFDFVFRHFVAPEVARPVLHLLWPDRVSQAWGSRPVTTIAYRRQPGENHQ